LAIFGEKIANPEKPRLGVQGVKTNFILQFFPSFFCSGFYGLHSLPVRVQLLGLEVDLDLDARGQSVADGLVELKKAKCSLQRNEANCVSRTPRKFETAVAAWPNTIVRFEKEEPLYS
jgi:hypothetical protein